MMPNLCPETQIIRLKGHDKLLRKVCVQIFLLLPPTAKMVTKTVVHKPKGDVTVARSIFNIESLV